MFGILVLLALFLVIGAPMLYLMVMAPVFKQDDKKEEFRFTGKIVEKNVEDVGAKLFGIKKMIDQIVVEKDDGTRIKLRNLRPEEIILTMGDQGEFTVRGVTIYNFSRTPKA